MHLAPIPLLLIENYYYLFLAHEIQPALANEQVSVNACQSSALHSKLNLVHHFHLRSHKNRHSQKGME